MMKINLENCNNISKCDIFLKKDSLNIYYAMNGTGKSTIGKAFKGTVSKKRNIRLS